MKAVGLLTESSRLESHWVDQVLLAMSPVNWRHWTVLERPFRRPGRRSSFPRHTVIVECLAHLKQVLFSIFMPFQLPVVGCYTTFPHPLVCNRENLNKIKFNPFLHLAFQHFFVSELIKSCSFFETKMAIWASLGAVWGEPVQLGLTLTDLGWEVRKFDRKHLLERNRDLFRQTWTSYSPPQLLRTC